MLKWQEEYLEDIKKMSNSEVLEEYAYYCSGDDYDGCMTSRGEWKFGKITEELNKRLEAVNFFSDEK